MSLEMADITDSIRLSAGRERARILGQYGLRLVSVKVPKGESLEAVISENRFVTKGDELPISMSHREGQKIVVFHFGPPFTHFNRVQKYLSVLILLRRAEHNYAGKTFLITNGCAYDSFARDLEKVIKEVGGKSKEETTQAIENFRKAYESNPRLYPE
jgi:hypothetical protein